MSGQGRIIYIKHTLPQPFIHTSQYTHTPDHTHTPHCTHTSPYAYLTIHTPHHTHTHTHTIMLTLLLSHTTHNHPTMAGWQVLSRLYQKIVWNYLLIFWALERQLMGPG